MQQQQQHVLWTRVGVLVELLQKSERHELWLLASAVPALGRFVLSNKSLISDAMDRFAVPFHPPAPISNFTLEVWRLPNNVVHRGGDKPAFTYSPGDTGEIAECYYENGINPFLPGFAPGKIFSVRDDGAQEWRVNGQLHGGPGVIYADGSCQYYKHGVPITF